METKNTTNDHWLKVKKIMPYLQYRGHEFNYTIAPNFDILMHGYWQL